MDIEINEVHEIIKNLEGGGELSIKEEKYLKIAKLCVKLAGASAKTGNAAMRRGTKFTGSQPMTSKLTRKQLHERARENVKALKMASRQTAFESAREEILADLQLAELALSAMDSEPVAEVVSIYGDPEDFGEREIRPLVGIQQMPCGTKLYRHAQPAPVVPDDVLAALQKVARIRLDMNDFDGDRRGIADCLCDAEESLIEVVNRRAAMLNGGKS